MRRNRNRNSRRLENRDRWTGIMFGFVGVVVLASLAFSYWMVSSRPTLDAVTSCPSTGPTGVRLLLVDHSDAVTEQQAQKVRQTVERIKATAGVGERIDVFTFTAGRGQALYPVFSSCVPPRPQNADPLTQNPEQIRKRFDERFSAAMDKALDELLLQEPQKTSPIIESLRAAAQTAFGGVESNGLPLVVTIVSDMVQHTETLSHLREEPTFERLAKSVLWPSLRPDLKGAKVEILYLYRPRLLRGTNPVQTRGHQLFWEQLIDASGGALETIDPT